MNCCFSQLKFSLSRIRVSAYDAGQSTLGGARVQADTRQDRILDILMRRGYAGIDELVANFDVTPQTIRRDLQELADQGLLRRHHGGASLMSSTAHTEYAHRHIENAEEKARIARTAADLIAPGSSIFMTPGTTIEAAATAIADAKLSGLRVITNSTVAAQTLGRNPQITVHVTGGRWQANNQSLVGESAAAFVADRYRCDVLLTSCGGVDPDGWLLEFRDDDVVVTKAMLANARRRILLVDHSKFIRVATCKLAPISGMTTIITDRAPSSAMQKLIRESKCELVVAGKS
jgi:DeoR family glycerol-3-phosphate regulon repressor